MRPPLRDGVSASRVQLPPGPWATALEFLVAHFREIPEPTWQARIERGLVLREDGSVLDRLTPYRSGETLHYYRELQAETPIPFEAQILYRDEHLLIADKPHFLPVIPAGRFVQETLLVRLKQATGLEDLVPLHRIDRGTAGLVAFSINPQTRGAYQQLFPRREVLKQYEALAPARLGLDFPITRRSRIEPGEPFFRMCETDGTANSETLIEVAERRGEWDLYRLFPVTGRKHQLRVHLAALGAPILHDPLYPRQLPEAEDDYTRPLKLLARALEFIDPMSGKQRRFESLRSLPIG